ncbi:MAG TPA: hypothetical protein VHT97_13965 [Acidimicrobiales bacterium]|nr:hypothetical protein [Acidimicrobiales bacterium]
MRSTHARGALAVAAMLALVGCSGGGGAEVNHSLGDAAIQAADVAASGGSMFQEPLDATPSPDGGVIYFTAAAGNGPGIFSVPAGGGNVSTVADGAPFVRPVGVAVGTDGTHVYAADQRVGSIDAPGAILTSAVTTTVSQVATVLPGTQGRSPRGLDVVRRDGADVVYFTGTDPATGSSGVFQVPAAGGTVTTVAEGPPFVSADSVVVTAQGVAYVTDRGAVPGQGQVIRVSGSTVEPILSSLRVGSPAGITLIHNDATLLVSTLDPKTTADQLTFLDLASGKTASATKGIGNNINTSGGLHRASNAEVLAWADTAGQVYRVRTR